jgi:hypothetical protein
MGIHGAYEAWPRSKTLPRIVGQQCRCAVGRVISREHLAHLDAGTGLRMLEAEVQRLMDEARGKA